MAFTSASPRQGALVFGSFELRRQPLALLRDGQPVELTAQPLRLLQLLAENAGRIVTHDEIRETLWTDRTVCYSGSTHVSVRRIRSALGDNADAPRFVETLPREGYRFVAPVKVHRARWRFTAGAMLAASVAAAALMTLVPAITQPGTVEPGEAVLLGEYLLTRTDADAPRRSLEQFETALADAPDDARALTGAAQAALRSREFDRAEMFAARLLSRQPEHAVARDVRGHVALIRDRNWYAARADFTAALRADPQLASAYHSMATLLILSGQNDAAIAHMREARRLDPASTLIQADLGWMQYYAGQFGDAAESCERALDLDPSMAVFRYCIVAASRELNDSAQARRHIAALMGQSELADGEAETVLGATNPARAFDQWRYTRFTAPGRSDTVPALLLAFAAAGAGNTHAAMAHLEDAASAGDTGVPFAFVDPAFAALHGTPRFEQLREFWTPQAAIPREITDRSGLPAAPSR